MEERPILFSSEMVCAIREQRKTQTRRLAGLETINQGKCDLYEYRGHGMFKSLFGGPYEFPRCRYGKPGDRLWVRETWAQVGKPGTLSGHLRYKADEVYALGAYGAQRWKPSIHMPRAASRITLKVTDVRIERLQFISEEDAEREGVKPLLPVADERYRPAFRNLWDEINGKKAPWEWNPWVWVISFEPVFIRL